MMGREFELKFRATPEMQQAIQEQHAPWQRMEMETTYYDTPTGELSRRKVTLRRRLENGISVCTVKTPAENDARGEWECLCDDIHLAVGMLCKLGAPEALKQWVAPGLVMRCGARFTRLFREIRAEGCVMELALDSGALLGGNKELPLCEVELEHKEGSEEATRWFSKAFAEVYGLSAEERSKFQRASALADEP